MDSFYSRLARWRTSRIEVDQTRDLQQPKPSTTPQPKPEERKGSKLIKHVIHNKLKDLNMYKERRAFAGDRIRHIRAEIRSLQKAQAILKARPKRRISSKRPE